MATDVLHRGSMSADLLPAEHPLPPSPSTGRLPPLDPRAEDAAWALYGDLSFEVTVSVPLKEMSLRDLGRVQAGTVFRSATFATEGAALSASNVFLANVSLEAAEDKLGFRINNFAPMRPRPAVPGSITGLRDAVKPAEVPAGILDPLLAMRVGLSLCFGTRRMQIREAGQLTSGDLIPLDRGLHDAVSIMANGRVVASGKLVLIDGCYAAEVLSTTPDLPAPGTEHGAATSAQPRVRLVQEPSPSLREHAS